MIYRQGVKRHRGGAMDKNAGFQIALQELFATRSGSRTLHQLVFGCGLITLVCHIFVAAGNAQQSSGKIGSGDAQNGPKIVGLSPEIIPRAPSTIRLLRLSPQKPPIKFVQEELLKADLAAGKLTRL